MVSKIKATHLNGFYYSKSQAAKILKLSPQTVQYHLDKGNLASVNMPGLGHHILESDVLEFQAKAPGRPTKFKYNL